jgi:hypothetical protein
MPALVATERRATEGGDEPKLRRALGPGEKADGYGEPAGLDPRTLKPVQRAWSRADVVAEGDPNEVPRLLLRLCARGPALCESPTARSGATAWAPIRFASPPRRNAMLGVERVSGCNGAPASDTARVKRTRIFSQPAVSPHIRESETPTARAQARKGQGSRRIRPIRARSSRVTVCSRRRRVRLWDFRIPYRGLRSGFPTTRTFIGRPYFRSCSST